GLRLGDPDRARYHADPPEPESACRGPTRPAPRPSRSPDPVTRVRGRSAHHRGRPQRRPPDDARPRRPAGRNDLGVSPLAQGAAPRAEANQPDTAEPTEQSTARHSVVRQPPLRAATRFLLPRSP